MAGVRRWAGEVAPRRPPDGRARPGADAWGAGREASARAPPAVRDGTRQRLGQNGLQLLGAEPGRRAPGPGEARQGRRRRLVLDLADEAGLVRALAPDAEAVEDVFHLLGTQQRPDRLLERRRERPDPGLDRVVLEADAVPDRRRSESRTASTVCSTRPCKSLR